jgi:hypothetical protein
MKKFILLFLIIACSDYKTQTIITPPDGGNKKAKVYERIGITDVTIDYNRPGVKGREGKIFGNLVHEGYANLGFGTSKAAPWRAGANENTTIAFSTDVKIEGKELPAGKYGFFVAYGPSECTLIFSKNYTSWGSFFYDANEDAIRVNVKPVALDKSVEWLKYEFMDQTENSATVALEWEKLMIAFKVEVDLVKTRIANIRLGLRNDDGFRWESFDEAANFCLNNNTNFEEALKWSYNAVRFDENFNTLSTTSMILDKLGRKNQSDSVMNVALEKGNVFQVHFYGKKLLTEKKNKEALAVFQKNAKKNPKLFITYAGLARGYSANGDYKTALANAKLALPLAPDDMNKKTVEGMIQKLERGADIN